MPKGKVPKPSAETLRRLKRRMHILKDRGIIDKPTIRREVAKSEAKYWLAKAKEWKPGTFEACGSAEFRAQMARTVNKMAVLLDRLEKVKTSVKRRRIIKQLSEIKFAFPEIEAKIPLEKRMDLEAVRLAVFDKLRELTLNKKLPDAERIEALRAFVKLAGQNAPEALIKMIKKSDRLLKKEIIRLLSKRGDVTTLETIEKKMLRSKDLNLKLIGLNILSNSPNLLAIVELARAIKFPRFEVKQVPERMLRRRKEELVQIIADQATLEKLTKDARALFERMQREFERVSGKKLDLYTNIFVVGMTARAIKQWFMRFGENPFITVEFRQGLAKELALHIVNLKRLSKEFGRPEEFNFAIRNLQEAIREIAKERG